MNVLATRIVDDDGQHSDDYMEPVSYLSFMASKLLIPAFK